MPFWKKNEDPWDIDPEKRRRPPAAEDGGAGEAAPGLLEQVKAWNETRKRRKLEAVPPSIPCPWCGKEMETGYLSSGRGVWWAPGRPGGWAKWISPDMEEGACRVDTEGTLFPYQTAWYCADCRRLAVEIPEQLPGGAFEEKLEQYEARQEKSKENDT